MTARLVIGDGTYVIQGPITVAQGATLTIQPETIVVDTRGIAVAQGATLSIEPSAGKISSGGTLNVSAPCRRRV